MYLKNSFLRARGISERNTAELYFSDDIVAQLLTMVMDPRLPVHVFEDLSRCTNTLHQVVDDVVEVLKQRVYVINKLVNNEQGPRALRRFSIKSAHD